LIPSSCPAVFEGSAVEATLTDGTAVALQPPLNETIPLTRLKTVTQTYKMRR